MEVARLAEAPLYTLPGHDEVTARRLQGAEASSASFVVVGHSTFPPGAVVPMDAGSISKIYVVTSGALTVEQADGRTHALGTGDSIFIADGEARAVRNQGGEEATMLVLTPPAAGGPATRS